MTADWRPGYATFLTERCAVPSDKVRFYVHWADRFLAVPPPGTENPAPEAVPRFLDLLHREKESWQVQQAEVAIRFYFQFRQREVVPPAPTPAAATSEWGVLVAGMVRILRLKHLSLRTEKSYLGWVRRFQAFTSSQPPATLSPADVERFLSHLAVDERVSASTQNQAFSALLFLFRHVLGSDLAGLGPVVRARERRRMPVVLSREEVRDVLVLLAGPYGRMGRMIYGCGLRLQECLELRVKDVDFERGLLTVRSGKGDKDRQTVLPQSLAEAWAEHREAVRRVHEKDRADGLPGVALPAALERKYPNAATEWAWSWAFPAAAVSIDPRTRIVRRHHQHPSALQKSFRPGSAIALNSISALAAPRPGAHHRGCDALPRACPR